MYKKCHRFFLLIYCNLEYKLPIIEFNEKGKAMFRKYFNRGIGLSLLAVLSIVVSVQATCVIKEQLSKRVPNIQDTINQLAPLKIENGTVVEPVNSYKEAYFKIFDNVNDGGLKIVLDTKDDTIDLNKIKDDVASIHLAKKKLYFVKRNEISQTDLSALSFNLEKKDYQEQMKEGISYWGNIFGIFMFVALTIYYLVVAIIFAITSFLFTIGQTDKPNFAARIRVSSLAIFLVSIIDMILVSIVHWGIPSLVYVVILAVLTLLFIRFIPIWKNKQ